jgi:large subunit ribosomal protein L6
MSRIGKKPVPVPEKVEIKISGQDLSVKGPKGELSMVVPAGATVTVDGGAAMVGRADDTRENRAKHGLVRSLLANMVEGVSKGFERKLEINGVGYKVEKLGGNFLRFDLGYSHPILYQVPAGVDVETDKRGENVTLRGVDKEVVGAAAAAIRGFRPPEPYKGKGVKYAEEVIKRKVGKSGGR